MEGMRKPEFAQESSRLYGTPVSITTCFAVKPAMRYPISPNYATGAFRHGIEWSHIFIVINLVCQIRV
jgi:hypothetical protein